MPKANILYLENSEVAFKAPHFPFDEALPFGQGCGFGYEQEHYQNSSEKKKQ